NIGKRNLSGKPSISGIESTFGPLFKLTCFASSYGKGSSNKLTSLAIFSGSLMIGYSPLCLRGSVITLLAQKLQQFQVKINKHYLLLYLNALESFLVLFLNCFDLLLELVPYQYNHYNLLGVNGHLIE